MTTNIPEHMNTLVPMVVEQSNKGERAYDIYSRLLKEAHKHDHSHDHDHEHDENKKVKAKPAKEKKSPTKPSKSKPVTKKVSKK